MNKKLKEVIILPISWRPDPDPGEPKQRGSTGSLIRITTDTINGDFNPLKYKNFTIKKFDPTSLISSGSNQI
jgi:hypothetical protein